MAYDNNTATNTTANNTATNTAANNTATNTAATAAIKVEQTLSLLTPAEAKEVFDSKIGMTLEIAPEFPVGNPGFNLAIGFIFCPYFNGTKYEEIPIKMLVVAGSVQLNPVDFIKLQDKGLNLSALSIVGWVKDGNSGVIVKDQPVKNVSKPIISFDYSMFFGALGIQDLIKAVIANSDDYKDLKQFVVEGNKVISQDNFVSFTIDPVGSGNLQERSGTNKHWMGRDIHSVNTRRTLNYSNPGVIEAANSRSTSGYTYTLERHNSCVDMVISELENEFANYYGGKLDEILAGPSFVTNGEAVTISIATQKDSKKGRHLLLNIQRGVLILGQLAERQDNKNDNAVATGNLAAIILGEVSVSAPTGAIPDSDISGMGKAIKFAR